MQTALEAEEMQVRDDAPELLADPVQTAALPSLASVTTQGMERITQTDIAALIPRTEADIAMLKTELAEAHPRQGVGNRLNPALVEIQQLRPRTNRP